LIQIGTPTIQREHSSMEGIRDKSIKYGHSTKTMKSEIRAADILKEEQYKDTEQEQSRRKIIIK